MTSVSPSQEIARAAHAWPFEEARKVLARLEKRKAGGKAKDYVLFETGYGPSGLPHIGTFGEVARTTWVRRAFEAMSDVKTRLISFSDDMDGLRKVPGNVPNQEMLTAHLGQPLTSVPDPFGLHESYGAHNNARLRAFLDRFGFEYEFLSSTECYKSGRFDAALLNVLQNYEKVRDIVLPTLGPERRADLFAVPAAVAAHGCRPPGSHSRMAQGTRHNRLRRRRNKDRSARHRRPLQAAVESGLGDALGSARHRLRNGRQGFDFVRRTRIQDSARVGRIASRRLQL